ncbi:hypothetical protein M8C21_022540, partial [Ambrosia artemisiifolia]
LFLTSLLNCLSKKTLILSTYLSSPPPTTMSTMAREDNVYMAKLSEQVERYEEMVQYMETVSNSLTNTEELTIKERNLLSVIEKELSRICDGILKLLDEKFVPSAGLGDSKVFYLKMKGDYHRYPAEFKTSGDRKEAAESTLNTYKAAQAFDEAIAELDTLGEDSYNDNTLIMLLERKGLY